MAKIKTFFIEPRPTLGLLRRRPPSQLYRHPIGTPDDQFNYVNLHTTPDHGIRFQHDFDQDVDAGSYNFPNNTYLKLTRTGNTITGYKSTDGATWTAVGATTVPMTQTIVASIFTRTP